MKSVLVLLLVVFSQIASASDTVEIFDFSSCQVRTEKILGRTAGIPAHHLGERIAEVLDTNSIDRIMEESACAAELEKAEAKAVEKSDDIVMVMHRGNIVFTPAVHVAFMMQIL